MLDRTSQESAWCPVCRLGGLHHCWPGPSPGRGWRCKAQGVLFEQGSQGWGPEGWPSVADCLPCPSAEKPVFFPAFAAEGQKLPTDPSCWTSGLPFPVPPREVIKASPHAPDPLAFSYAPPGE